MSAAALIAVTIAIAAMLTAFDRPVTTRPSRTVALLLGGALAVALLASLRHPAITDHNLPFAALLLGAAMGALLLRRPASMKLPAAMSVLLPGLVGLAAFCGAIALLWTPPPGALPNLGLFVAALAGIGAMVMAWLDRDRPVASAQAVALAGAAVAGLGLGTLHLFVVAAGGLTAAAAATLALRGRT